QPESSDSFNRGVGDFGPNSAEPTHVAPSDISSSEAPVEELPDIAVQPDLSESESGWIQGAAPSDISRQIDFGVKESSGNLFNQSLADVPQSKRSALADNIAQSIKEYGPKIRSGSSDQTKALANELENEIAAKILQAQSKGTMTIDAARKAAASGRI